MAKKKSIPEQSPESTTPDTAAPKRRVRTKKNAAPPIDVAAVAGIEPRDNGASTRQSAESTLPARSGRAARNTDPTRAEIAEAAYYRHLNRGSGQGDQFNDWIEAERELRERRSR